MTAYEAGRYEMFKRVCEFGRTYSQSFPEASDAARTFALMAKTVAELDRHASARRDVKDHGWRQKKEAADALMAQLCVLERIASDEARRVPGAAEMFPRPRRRCGEVTLLQHGRLYVQECAKARNMFLRFGMPETFVDDLQALVEAFERSMSRGWNRRTTIVVSRLGKERALAEGLKLARSLDIIVSNVLTDKPELLAVWKNIRRNESRPVVGSRKSSVDSQQSIVGSPQSTVEGSQSVVDSRQSIVGAEKAPSPTPVARRRFSLPWSRANKRGRDVVVRLGLLLLFALSPRAARADGTFLVGAMHTDRSRPAIGWAYSYCPSVVGFEIEYFGTRPGNDQDHGSAGGILASIIVQPMRDGRIQPYGIGGFGLYGETYASGGGTGEAGATNIGGGVKIGLAGPLRLRIDYRVFMLGSLDDASRPPSTMHPQRLAVGLHVVF